MHDYQQHWQHFKNNARAPLFAMLILLICIAFCIISLINSLMQTGNSTSTVKVNSSSPLVIHNIAQYHLFGKYDDNLANLPQTQLQLTLEGTVFSPNQQHTGYALISSPSTPTKVYHIGDNVPGGATIYKVENNQVILKYNNQLQSLRLPIETILIDGESGRNY